MTWNLFDPSTWGTSSTPTSTAFGVGTGAPGADLSGYTQIGSTGTNGLTMGNLATAPQTTGAGILGGVSIGGAGAAGGGTSGALGISGLGANVGTLQAGIAGVGVLGNLWNSYQANQLAQKSFAQTQKVQDTNLNNSISSYNTNLADRENTRAKVNGLTAEQANAYIGANSAKAYT